MTVLNNIRFNYLYRDASNYKKWGSVTFSNPDRLSPADIENELSAYFDHQRYFIASLINIPEVFLFINDYPFSEDDHFFHEYDSLETTNEDVTDSKSRTIREFIKQCKQVHQRGWWLSLSNAHS